MKKGIFISFEGPDGSGKTMMIKMVDEEIKKTYKDTSVVLTREPGGTNNQIAEDIRNILLNKIDYKIDYRAEALLFAASRAQHVKDFIMPHIEQGDIVLCDRYIDSSLVYQGIGRKLGIEKIWTINEFAMNNVIPNCTFVLMVDPKIGLARINANKNREVNRLDKEKINLHQQVYAGYRYLIDNDHHHRLIEIDASKNPVDVLAEIMKHLNVILTKHKHG